MSLAFNGSTTSKLTRSGAVGFTAYPFSVAVWIKPTASVNRDAVLARLEGSDTLGVLCDSLNGNKVCAWRTPATYYPSTAAPDPTSWHLVLVVYASSSSRRIYYKSSLGNAYTGTVFWNLSALNTLTVGLTYNGELAHLAMWRAALSAADYNALVGGAVPSTVQSSSLIDYWPLLTQANSHTGLNGRALTASNTVQGTSDPPVGSGDMVPPTLTGSLSVSNNTTGTSYSLAWPGGSDNVGVTAYEVSLDGGASFTSVGSALGAAISGRTPGTTDAVRVRARDAAGNISSPPLATSVVLPIPADTTPPVLTGSITVSNNTTGTSYTLAWPAGTDNVAVVAYEVSLDAGASYASVGNVLGASITGRTPSTTDQVRVRARDGAGKVSSPPLATSVVLPVPADTTLPVLSGSITVSGLTSTGYTLSWPAGSDNVAVAAYERSLDAGSTWVNVGNVLTVAISGRTPGTTDQVRARARDAAGNVSSPALSTSVTLPGGASATLVTPPMKNNAGTLLANLTGITVNVYNASTGVLVLRKTGLTSSASGVVTIIDVALVAGTSYAYEVVTPSNGRRLPTGTVS